MRIDEIMSTGVSREPMTRRAEAVAPRGAEDDGVAMTRAHQFNTQKKEPLADQIARPAKRQAGRTPAPEVPANIRVSGVDLDDKDRNYIRQRLGLKLGKFAESIERVTVRVRDINGDRGGVDQECAIKVVLSGRPSVVAESRSSSTRGAVNAAMSSAEQGVRRSVQRRRWV